MKSVSKTNARTNPRYAKSRRRLRRFWAPRSVPWPLAMASGQGTDLGAQNLLNRRLLFAYLGFVRALVLLTDFINRLSQGQASQPLFGSIRLCMLHIDPDSKSLKLRGGGALWPGAMAPGHKAPPPRSFRLLESGSICSMHKRIEPKRGWEA